MQSYRECPICFESIDLQLQDTYYTLECCKNDIHIKCIIEWLQKAQKDNDNSICILCRSKTEIFDDFYNNINMNSNHTIDISNNSNDLTILLSSNNTINNTNNFCNFCLCINVIGFFIILPFFLINY